MRGHFTAFYITASAKAFNTYGDVAQKEKVCLLLLLLFSCFSFFISFSPSLCSSTSLRFYKQADYMVAQMAKCQEALGNGYLSAFPESFFDRLEALQPVWVCLFSPSRLPFPFSSPSSTYSHYQAPYYMIHKIMQALWDMYTLTGNQQAYPMILNMVDYFVARIRNVVAEYTVFRYALFSHSGPPLLHQSMSLTISIELTNNRLDGTIFCTTNMEA